MKYIVFFIQIIFSAEWSIDMAYVVGTSSVKCLRIASYPNAFDMKCVQKLVYQWNIYNMAARIWYIFHALYMPDTLTKNVPQSIASNFYTCISGSARL